MAFYRLGEMTIDEAEIIAKDLGLENGAAERTGD